MLRRKKKQKKKRCIERREGGGGEEGDKKSKKRNNELISISMKLALQEQELVKGCKGTALGKMRRTEGRMSTLR